MFSDDRASFNLNGVDTNGIPNLSLHDQLNSWRLLSEESLELGSSVPCCQVFLCVPGIRQQCWMGGNSDLDFRAGQVSKLRIPAAVASVRVSVAMF